MKKTLCKLTFFFVALFVMSACSSEDETDKTTGNIQGIWQSGAIYGTATSNGFNATVEGNSEGTIDFKTDGTYESIIESGYVTVTISALNFSETTQVDPENEVGLYSYNATTDDLIINGQSGKVLVLNANFMKIKTIITQDDVVSELYSEYTR